MPGATAPKTGEKGEKKKEEAGGGKKKKNEKKRKDKNNNKNGYKPFGLFYLQATVSLRLRRAQSFLRVFLSALSFPRLPLEGRRKEFLGVPRKSRSPRRLLTLFSFRLRRRLGLMTAA